LFQSLDFAAGFLARRAPRNGSSRHTLETGDEVGRSDRSPGSFGPPEFGEAHVAPIGEQLVETGAPLQNGPDAHPFVVDAGQMGAHARPWPVLGARHQSCPDRIEAHIAHGRHQVILVHGHRGEPALEQVAAPPAPGVDEIGVAPMRLAHGPAKDQSKLHFGRSCRGACLDPVRRPWGQLQ
jgi:hypothetical protein